MPQELAEAAKMLSQYERGPDLMGHYGVNHVVIDVTFCSLLGELNLALTELDTSEFVVLLCGCATKAQRAFHKQIRNFREAFKLFDSDGGGSVSLEEFIEVTTPPPCSISIPALKRELRFASMTRYVTIILEVMELFGHIEVDKKALSRVLVKYDSGHSGEINFVEFLGMMAADDPLVQRDIKSHVVGFREVFFIKTVSIPAQR